MANHLYYLQSVDKALSPYEIKRSTGLDPETVGVVALNSAGVYPIVDVDNPYDIRLYDVTKSYTINGTNADETWSKTDKDLATAKEVAKKIVKEEAEVAAEAARGEYGAVVLIAIASKTSAQRSANETVVIDSLKTTATNLSNDIIAIDAATDVDAIDAIVNP